jgi:hypothetical protein
LLPIVISASSLYKVEQDTLLLKSISNPAFPENKPTVKVVFDEIINNPASDPFYKFRASFFYYDMGYPDEAYSQVSKLLEADPINLDFLLGMVFLEESKNNITNLISLRKRIAVVDPWNAENYLQLLKLYKATGDSAGVEEMRTKIFSFASGTDIAKTASDVIG